jgi:hypothetical protein
VRLYRGAWRADRPSWRGSSKPATYGCVSQCRNCRFNRLLAPPEIGRICRAEASEQRGTERPPEKCTVSPNAQLLLRFAPSCSISLNALSAWPNTLQTRRKSRPYLVSSRRPGGLLTEVAHLLEKPPGMGDVCASPGSQQVPRHTVRIVGSASPIDLLVPQSQRLFAEVRVRDQVSRAQAFSIAPLPRGVNLFPCSSQITNRRTVILVSRLT